MPAVKLLAVVCASKVQQGLSVNFMSLAADVGQTGDVGQQDDGLPVRQDLHNIGDVQYTLPLVVGGQSIAAIPDTGSFDLLVFSKRCVKCGDTANLFDDLASATYNKSFMDAEQTFGSGKTESIEAFDTAGLGAIEVKNQVFWEVVDADMPLLTKATFQAILGAGPPRGAVKIADKEAKGMEEEVSDMEQRGLDVPASYRDTVQHYADVAKHVRTQTQLLKRLGLQSFSICLQRDAGSPGTWIWRDNAAELQPSLFVHVPVVGDTYWSAELGSVRLAGGGEPVATSGGAVLELGCHSEKCLGVVDTGTSLLVMPSSAYKLVADAVSTWSEQGSDCTDLSRLPNLEFKLGGEGFSLPPDSYVGQMTGDLPAELAAYMPHVQTGNRGQDGGGCTPLLMATDEDSPEGEIWIIGLPLFRKYYTTFNLGPGSEQGRSLSFALAGPRCELQSKHEQLFREAESPRKPLRIDASKLRMPKLGPRARLQSLAAAVAAGNGEGRQ